MVQLRWAYSWLALELLAAFTGLAGAFALTIRFAMHSWAQRAVAGQALSDLVAVVALALAVTAVADRVGQLCVVRRYASTLVARLDPTPPVLEHLLFSVESAQRRYCADDLIPTEAIRVARTAAVGAIARHLKLDREQLPVAVALCARWPGNAPLLVRSVRDLDFDQRAVLTALASSWTSSPEQLVEAARTL